MSCNQKDKDNSKPSDDKSPKLDEAIVKAAIEKYSSEGHDALYEASYLNKFFFYWVYKIIKVFNIFKSIVSWLYQTKARVFRGNIWWG